MYLLVHFFVLYDIVIKKKNIMYTFLLVFILAIVVARCFYKNNFAQNRLKVMLIAGIVSYVVLMIVNFSVRSTLSTDIKINRSFNIKQYNDSVMCLIDTINDDTLSIELFNEIEDSTERANFLANCDTIYKDTLYWYTKDDDEFIFLKKNGDLRWVKFNKVNLLTEYTDTIPVDSVIYGRIDVCFEKYNTDGNRWLTKSSLANKNRFFKIYLPNVVTFPDSTRIVEYTKSDTLQ